MRSGSLLLEAEEEAKEEEEAEAEAAEEVVLPPPMAVEEAEEESGLAVGLDLAEAAAARCAVWEECLVAFAAACAAADAECLDLTRKEEVTVCRAPPFVLRVAVPNPAPAPVPVPVPALLLCVLTRLATLR